MSGTRGTGRDTYRCVSRPSRDTLRDMSGTLSRLVSRFAAQKKRAQTRAQVVVSLLARAHAHAVTPIFNF
jgi:hypothetical protein